MALHIITDSTSEITQQEAKKLNLHVVPLTVSFGSEEFTDGINLTPTEFYAKMRVATELPKTSQVSLATFMEVFEKIPAEDEVLGIFLSSELSGTFQAAKLAADTLNRKNLHLVDSRTVSFALASLVLIALQRRQEGVKVQDIVQELETLKLKLVIHAVIADLKYLKMGGRLSSAASAIGTVLHLRPIIEIKDGKVVVVHKTLGTTKALNWMIQQMNQADPNLMLPHFMGHSDAQDNLARFQKQLIENSSITFDGVYPIGITVGTHAGPGCVGICYFKK